MNPKNAYEGISLDFSEPKNDISLDFSEQNANIEIDFSDAQPLAIREMPHQKAQRLSRERKAQGITSPKWTLENEVKEDIARRERVAKGSVKGLAAGLTFGISNKWVKPPETDEESKAYDIGNVFGSVAPVMLAEKAIVAPIVYLASQTGKASKFLQPLARLAGWGGVGATEETIKSAVEKGELPTKEDVLKKGAAYAGIDAVIQALGVGGQFAKKINTIAESKGMTNKDVINEIVDTLKGKNHGVTDWARVDPEVLGKATEEVEQKLLGMGETIEAGGVPPKVVPPNGPIPVESTEKGLVVQGTKQPIPKSTKEIEIRAEDIDPFTKEKRKVNVGYVPPTEGSSREQIAKHVVLEQPKSIKEPWTKERAITAAYDDLYPLKKLAEESKVPSKENPYYMAYQARNSAGRAKAVLEHAQYDYLTKEFTGPGVAKIFSRKAIKSIPGFSHDDLNYYLVAGSSLDRQALGQRNPIPTQAAMDFIKDNEKYFPVAKQLIEFNDQGFLNEKNNGWWSEAEFANAKENYKTYVPLYRLMDEGKGSVIPGNKSFKPSYSLRKQAKGSTRPILAPIQSIVKNAVLREQAMAKNDVMNAVRNALEKLDYVAEHAEPVLSDKKDLQRLMGEDYEVTDAQIPFLSKGKEFYGKDAFKMKDGMIYGYRDGKKWIMRDVPADIVNAINSMGNFERSAVEKFLGAARRFYSGVRVGSPDVQFRLLVQDQFISAMTSRTLNGISGPVQQFFMDWPAAIFDVFSKSKVYQQYLLSGAFENALRDIGRDDIANFSSKLTGEKLKEGRWNIVKMLYKVGKGAVDEYLGFFEKLGTATKLSEFKRSIEGKEFKEAMTEASFNALEFSLNYARKGSEKSFYQVFNVVPWLRIWYQDGGKIAETLADPGSKRFKNLMITGSLLSTFGAMYYLKNKNDERYQALTDREKRTNYYFYRTNNPNEEPLKMRRPWLFGALFSTPAESAAEFIDRRDPSAFKQVYQTMLQESLPFDIGDLQGKSSLFKSRLDKLDNELQLVQSTSDVAKVTSKLLNNIFPESWKITPLFVDYWNSAIFGKFGTYGFRLLDEATQGKNYKRPEDKLADSMLWGTFFARGPKKSTSHLEHYYELYDQNEMRANSVKALQTQKKMKEAREYEATHPHIDMKLYQGQLKAKLRKIDALFASEKYSRKEKRELLDNEYTELSNMYEKLYEQANKTLEKKTKKQQ